MAFSTPSTVTCTATAPSVSGSIAQPASWMVLEVPARMTPVEAPTGRTARVTETQPSLVLTVPAARFSPYAQSW